MNDMNDYRPFNANPKGKKTGDCVIRAISVALDKPYLTVYKELFQESEQSGYMLNDPKCYSAYLAKQGWIKHKPITVNFKKIRVMEFPSQRDAVLIHVAKHLTVIKKGKVLDTWDCRKKIAYNYYTFEGTV